MFNFLPSIRIHNVEPEGVSVMAFNGLKILACVMAPSEVVILNKITFVWLYCRAIYFLNLEVDENKRFYNEDNA